MYRFDGLMTFDDFVDSKLSSKIFTELYNEKDREARTYNMDELDSYDEEPTIISVDEEALA